MSRLGESLAVTLPPKTTRLVGRWVEHLASTIAPADAQAGDTAGAVRELRQAGLVPRDMTDDEARVLLVVAIELGRPEIARPGVNP
jgi:hypothetical protein